jgi:hypothetical protein
MPGTNHEIEPGFMDALSFSLRPAATDLLMHYRIKQLMEMKREGPYFEVKHRFELTPDQWNTVLNTVLLSKLSYFLITPEMKDEHLDLIQKIAGECLGQPGMSLKAILERTENSYTFFSQFILKIIEVKRLKQQIRRTK